VAAIYKFQEFPAPAKGTWDAAHYVGSFPREGASDRPKASHENFQGVNN